MLQLYNTYSRVIKFTELPDPTDIWELEDLIGEGTYGDVYTAKHKVTGEKVAVKVLDSIHEMIEEIEQEFIILSEHGDHPNMPKFYGLFLKPGMDNQIWIVMELCGKGSVTHLSREVHHRGEKLDEMLIAHILHETLSVLAHLHSQNIIHRDVKGHNILINDSGEVKIIDFGVSAILENSAGRRKTSVGTPYWMAPEAVSQTEWVTCYTLHKNLSDRVNFTVNLIDTPGFGDTRGLDNDKKIVEQIRQLFISKGEKGVATIDAVCFILKAPDARLTTTQRYIFESVLSLFGNDIKDNICTLITFADGQRPPVLSGIQALDGLPLPFEKYFTFNNSALYVDNTGNSSNSLTPFFWKMGIQSCESFFDHMNNMQTKSLLLTSEVLRKRAKLENTILNLQQEIDVGLSKINVLEKEAEIFRKHAKAILENKNFEYDVDEDIQEKIDLTGKSQYTTNCLICNFTCHESCSYPNDQDKAKCCSMNKDGNCTQCPKGCNWKEHHNTPYIIKWTKRKVKKRYEDMKRKYEEATQQTLTQEQVLEEMNQDIFIQEQGIQVMMEIITKLNNRLKEIALRPDPLSTEQYIDLMIASELREKKSGFDARVTALHKCKQRTKYGESVQIFQDRVANTRRTMAASDVADELIKEDKSVIGWFKNLFKQKK